MDNSRVAQVAQVAQAERVPSTADILAMVESASRLAATASAKAAARATAKTVGAAARSHSQPAPPQDREYQPLWEAIKSAAFKGRSITIQCESFLAKRIDKAVRKEKWKDSAYKKVYHGTLHATFTASGITFVLDQVPSCAVLNEDM